MELKRVIRGKQSYKGLLTLFISGLLMLTLSDKVIASPNAQSAENGQVIFDQKCKACHTIGGGSLVGPDLLGVTEKRDQGWLFRWIREPDVMLAKGDPIATGLLEDFNNVPMPNLALTDNEVEEILAFLASAEPQSAELISLTGGDASRGKSIFVGKTALQNGAPACMSCHSSSGIGLLGGGTLGPDLTNVVSRYGENGMAGALINLPFPSMQAVFSEQPLTDNEAADLYAYLLESDQNSVQNVNLNFILIAIPGFIAFIVFSHFIWNKRHAGVRVPLVGR